VLPHIHHKERLNNTTKRHGTVRVIHGLNGEMTIHTEQPHPPTAEVTNSSLRELERERKHIDRRG
jgi:exosome complex RNA-binding protein Rrp4